MNTAQSIVFDYENILDYGQFIDQLSDPVIIFNNSAGVIRANAAANQRFDIGHDNRISNQSVFQLIPDLKAGMDFPFFAKDRQTREISVVLNNQNIALKVSPFFDDKNHLLVLHRSAEKKPQENLLQLVLESIPARVFWKDLEGNYLGCNSKFASDAGKECSTELLGLSDFDVFPSEGAMYIADDLEVMSSGVEKLNIEEPQTTPTGDEIWLSTNKVPIRDENGDVIGIMGSYTDITERIRHQQLVEHQARFDHLTEMPNRLALQEKLLEIEQDISVVQGGLLFIDLDHFKNVNDSLGHEVGDELLKQVANRINAAVDGRGFTVRLGGDEFSVLVTVDAQNARADINSYLIGIANTIRESILLNFNMQRHTLRLGVSIGITLIEENTTNWSSKFNEADMAMYEAKAAGRNRVVVFDETMRKKLDFNHALQSRLENACENDEFHLVVQPQFDAHNNWLGGEALLRWENPELGSVPPNEFIPICEQSGLIHKIGLMAFEKALELVASWSEQYGVENVRPLAVNLSPKQFQKKGFIDDISALLLKRPIDPSLIQFELTESLLLDNKDDALKKLNRLVSMGFTLAIDDFGTGYSSLSYLSQLPVEKIKIDRSFTRQIMESPRQKAIVETIITMAKNLDMNVIAKGVETVEQLNSLKNMGCKEFQGFLLGRPTPTDEYASLVFSGVKISK